MTWTAKIAGIFKVGNFRKSLKMLVFFVFFPLCNPSHDTNINSKRLIRPANSSHPQNVIFVFIQVKEKERDDSKGDKPLLKEVIIIANKLIFTLPNQTFNRWPCMEKKTCLTKREIPHQCYYCCVHNNKFYN